MSKEKLDKWEYGRGPASFIICSEKFAEYLNKAIEDLNKIKKET